MRNNGASAALYMGALARNNAGGVKGLCLRTCRLAWGLPPHRPSAIEEWNSIPNAYKRNDPTRAPIGAPHFWSVGKYGHIAIQAEHEGFVWSTDAPKTDRVGLVDITWFSRNWRAKYLGWSLYLNGQILPLAGEAPKG